MRKITAIILTLCIAALCAACAGPTNNEDFTGLWQRTNVEQALRAQIEITEQTDTQFRFSIYAAWAAHSGEMDDVATITAPNRAECVIIDDIFGEEVKIIFILRDETLFVAYEGSQMALGFGMNVEPDGVYTKDEPEYINANIINEIFPTEEIRANMIALLGEEGFAYITEVMEYGFRWDRSGDFTYSGIYNGAGMGVDLVLEEDGKIYCLVYDIDEYIFYTNDPAYRDRLPDLFASALSKRGECPLSFVYNPFI